MLQTADLTIRLHPADDFVIARTDLQIGTQIVQENIRTRASIPAGPPRWRPGPCRRACPCAAATR